MPDALPPAPVATTEFLLTPPNKIRGVTMTNAASAVSIDSVWDLEEDSPWSSEDSAFQLKTVKDKKKKGRRFFNLGRFF